jgi:PleD family two-component response regulator
MPGNQTVSAGVACWNGRESAEELVGRADAALYEAKRSGRDRLVTAGGTPPGDLYSVSL